MDPLLERMTGAIDAARDEIVALRRDIHAHPELSSHEVRTTTVVAEAVADLPGTDITQLPGSGLVVDLGASEPRARFGLRADIDALPIPERSGLPFASVNEAISHSCGHDVHTAALYGGLVGLAAVGPELTRAGIGVRAIFQPAEELLTAGAKDVVAGGWVDDLEQIFAVHCDPSIDVGSVGLRVGPITAATDALTVRLSGRGGHTSRPHLTDDLAFALAKVVTELPAQLSRRVDPRAGVSLVWGQVRAGNAPNVIPGEGLVAGTVRMLDVGAWERSKGLVEELVHATVAPYRVRVEVDYVRGVPPVVNDVAAIGVLTSALDEIAATGVATAQSMGGEDFAWYLQRVDGALARLGTRRPGGPTHDLHQGDLVIDERALTIGAHLFAATTVQAARAVLYG